MSSLIAKQPKDTRKQTTVSLKGSVVADLELYCQFIDSPRDWVINEALKTVFGKDKAFLEWKERSGHASTNGNAVVHAMLPTDMPSTQAPRPARPTATGTNKTA